MVRSVRLWRAVLQRSRSDWPVVLAAWLLMLAATTLLATGALYADTVGAGGVRRTILDASPADRAIVVRTTAARPSDVDPLDGPIRASIAASIATTGGEVASVLRSGSFADASVPRDEVSQLTQLIAYEGIDRHAELTDGAWAEPGSRPIQAALPRSAAAALGVGIGDRLSLVSRLDAHLVVDVEIAGLYGVDPDDPFWTGDPLEVGGVVPSDPYTTVGPVVVARQDLLGPAVGGRLEAQWRGIPAIERLQVDDIAPLRLGIDQLDDRLRAALPGRRQLSIEARLPQLLDETARSVIVGRSGVALLMIQFAILAGYAVVLVGGLLLERRRAETALLRSRGATSVHLLAMALVEGLVLAALAVAAAPWLAVGVVRLLADAGPLGAAGIVTTAELTPLTVLVAAAAGFAGVIALAAPAFGSSLSLSGVRAAIGRQSSQTLPQRLGVDLALVAVAALAIWQLRLYGAPLTRDARGVLGVDPLLVAAPAIGLIGGAVLALRIVPRLAEVGERVLERRRGLVAPLGGRQLARRPLRYTRAALLLMLAAGLGTFATSHAATWVRSQGDQAAYQAAADVRVIPSTSRGVRVALAGAAYRSIDGVAAAMPVTRQTLDLGREVRGGPLLALDARAAASIVTFQPGSGTATGTAALARLVEERPEPALFAIPGTPRRLAILASAAIVAQTLDEPRAADIPTDHLGMAGAVVVLDADGRAHRITGQPSPIVAGGQRLIIPLGAPDAASTGEPAWPLHLVALEITVTPPPDLVLSGTLDLLAVEAGDAAGGERWTRLALDPATSGWRWTQTVPGATDPLRPVTGAPARISFGIRPEDPPPIFPRHPSTFRQIGLPATAAELPVVASRTFLEATAARIGESITAASHGLRLPIRIITAVDDFPSVDPAQPFVILDAAGFELNRFALTGQVLEPHEWWLDTEAGRSEVVAEAARRPPFEGGRVVERTAVVRSLSSDPVSLGLIGALSLGAVGAMVFAGIGFIVSATVSTSERVGEFALLRALGLSGRQLAVWLSLESAFLLIVGLLAGSALGVLLAWLVLPFATLTETGAPAVPAAIVVVPWQAILPSWLLAIVLLAVTVGIVRRQLPAVRVSSVLRARDE